MRIILLFCIPLLASLSAFSQPVILDALFDSDGIVTVDNGDSEYCSSMSLLSDGRVIIAGPVSSFGSQDCQILAFHQDGSLDTSFGNGGVVNAGEIYSPRIALDPQEKIVIAGSMVAGGYENLFISRYHNNGTIDSSFGGNGVLIVDLAPNSEEYFGALTIQNDGKIILSADEFTNGRLLIARFNADGSLDSTFSTDGIFSEALDIYVTYLQSDLILQPDGKIILAGYYEWEGDQFALIRLNEDGTLDSAFSGDGIVSTDFTAQPDVITGITLQADGKIVAVGIADIDLFPDENPYMALSRYHPDGLLDSSFSDDGKWMYKVNGYHSYAWDVIIQSGDKILLVGSSLLNFDPTPRITMVRLQQDGAFDLSFDGDGIDTTELYGGDGMSEGFEILVQPDNKILIGGWSSPSYNTYENLCVLRYLNCAGGVADFTSSALNLTCQFTDQSSNAISWSWDFGDGNTSALQNPLHTYSAEGNYNVCLTIIDSCGSNTSCENVTVCNPLNTDFLYQLNELSIQMLNQLTEADSFFWDFGDGTTSSDQNPVHTFSSSGIYHVCLIEWDDCTSDTICKEIIICGVLTTDFIYNATDLSVQFTDASVNAISWNWSFGDGNFSSDQNPLHEYSLPGIYNACLSTFNGCSYDTLCQSITIIANSTDLFTVHPSLFTIYPNPFNESISIQFYLEKEAVIQMDLIDLSGRKICAITNRSYESGTHTLQFDARQLSQGFYLLNTKAEHQSFFVKLIKQEKQ